MKRQLKKIHNKDSGMVSILVTMFLMVIITLIVIGFAKIIRREQRQVLDRQLSTQAFYAAESGINDAKNILATNPGAAKPNCDATGASAAYAGLNGQLDIASGVAYTCLLVDPAPPNLQYNPLNTNSSKTVPITSKDGTPFTTITIGWEASQFIGNGFSLCPTSPALPPSTSWPADQCDAGILRIDLVPTNNLSRGALANGLTAFLYPKADIRASSSQSWNFSDASGGTAGAILTGKCNSGSQPRLCSVTFNVSGSSSSSYALHVRPIYKSAGITVSGMNGTTALSLSGAQAVIDSTGKASDVLRRIAVRVSLNGDSTGTPMGAIQSAGNICKRFTVNGAGLTPTDDSSPSNCSF